MKMKVRLLGPVVDDYISEGIVQVEHEGKWGYICPSKWKTANTYVLCGQLGFPNDAESYAVVIQDVEPVYWLDHVTCKGWESSIVSCDHSGLGVSECEGGQALKIKCVRKKSDKVSLDRLLATVKIGVQASTVGTKAHTRTRTYHPRTAKKHCSRLPRQSISRKRCSGEKKDHT